MAPKPQMIDPVALAVVLGALHKEPGLTTQPSLPGYPEMLAVHSLLGTERLDEQGLCPLS